MIPTSWWMTSGGTAKSGARGIFRIPILKPSSQIFWTGSVVTFNAMKGWARDASAEIATELRHRSDLQTNELPSSIADFVEMYEASRKVR
jgi:hypothetical protein